LEEVLVSRDVVEVDGEEVREMEVDEEEELLLEEEGEDGDEEELDEVDFLLVVCVGFQSQTQCQFHSQPVERNKPSTSSAATGSFSLLELDELPDFNE
jgi:hypothetical protein